MSSMTMSRSNLWERRRPGRSSMRRSGRPCTACSALFEHRCSPARHNVSVRPAFAHRAVLRLRVRPDRRPLHRPRRQRDRRPAHRVRPARPPGTGAWPTASSGFVAGLAPLYLASWMAGTISRRAIAGAIAGAIGAVLGFLFVFTDIWVGGSSIRRRRDRLVCARRRGRPDRRDHRRPDPGLRLGTGEGTTGSVIAVRGCPERP